MGREPSGLGLAGRRLSRFVGRRSELALLLDRARCAAAGTGQAVALIGEPGVGKSRLVLELRLALAAEGLRCWEGHSMSYGAAVPYLPLVDLLRRAWQLRDGSPPETVIGTVQAELAALGLPAVDLGPFLLALLGTAHGTETLAGLTPEAVRTRTFAALRQILLGAAARQPLVLLVEDLHWSDRTSEAFLTELVDTLPSTPLLLVATTRPGIPVAWLDRSWASQLALPALGRNESREVVSGVLGDGAAPALVDAIGTRGEGNPFFLEELAWALSDGPGTDGAPAAVPATIRDTLAARMDSLPPAPRLVLDTASVLGRETPVRLLEALLPEGRDLRPALRELIAREFLYEAPGLVIFKHVTQDVAYDRLDSVARRQLHAAAGHAYERLWADRLDEVLDRLAHHFTRAEDRERAVVYLTRLGERLTAGYTLAEALAVLLEGLDAARRLPDEHGDRAVLDILERLTMTLIFMGRLAESVELLEREGRRYTRHPASPLTRRYRAWLAVAAVHVGRYDVVEASARFAVDASAGIEHDVTLAVAYWALATRSFFVSRHADGVTQGQRAVDSLAPLGPTAWHERYWLSHGHWMLGWNAVVCGDLVRADAAGADTARIGEAMEDPRIQSYGLSERAWSAALRGELPGARVLAERARELAPDPLCRAVVASLFGCVMCEAGDPASAMAAVQPAREQFQAFGMQSMAGWSAAVLAEAALAMGQLDQGGAWATKAASEGAEAGFPYVRALGRRMLGRVAHGTGKLEKAGAHLQQALDDFAGIGARYEEARTRLDLARVSQASGERTAATAQLAEAHGAFGQLGVPYWAERTAQLARDLGLVLAGPASQAEPAPRSRHG